MVTFLRSRSIGVMAVAVCAAAGLFFYANPATSQSGPDAECTGDVVATLVSTGFDDRTNKIYSYSDNDYMLTSFTVELPPIAAGTFDVNAVSYDGYTGRADVPTQPAEQWRANLLSADGTVLASTAATPDLADDVEETTWSGALGQISWEGDDAVALQFQHASPGGDIPNSVSPSCLGLTRDTPTEIKSACVPNPDLDVTCDDDPVTTASNPPADDPPIVIAQVPDPEPTPPAFTG